MLQKQIKNIYDNILGKNTDKSDMIFFYIFLKNPKEKYFNYLKTYSLFLLFFMIPIIMNYCFLRNGGEFLTAKEICDRQNEGGSNNVIYGSALFNDVSQLKLEHIKIKKPKIIVFGSSRVFQFRNSFFSKSFYNFGCTSSVRHGLEIAHLIIQKHCPEVIIMGIDFWWFNEIMRKPEDYDKMQKLGYEHMQLPDNTIDPGHLLLPLKWIKNGVITLTDYSQLFQLSSKPHIGIRGKLKKSGFSSDGSYYYTDTIIGENNESKTYAQRSKSNLERREPFFPYASAASELHFQKFIELIKFFEDKGVKVILFFPPVDSEVNKEMDKLHYSFMQDLKNKFQRHKINIYDFTDPTKAISTNDCEFVDSTHGGDVIYAKILHYISSKETILKEYVNPDYLEIGYS